MRRKRQREQESGSQELGEGLMMLTGMKEWRQQHPTATLREIEEAVDERIKTLRAGMLEELVKMSSQAEWSEAAEEEKPRCEQCGERLVSRGKRSRSVQTSGGKQIEIERSYGTCPKCGQGLFPPG